MIITYGYALNLVLESSKVLAYDYEIFPNVIALQIISPLNLDFAYQHLKMAKTVILVEECDGASGLAGLLTSELQRLNITVPVKIVSGQGIVGASLEAEENALLSSEKIVKALVGEG